MKIESVRRRTRLAFAATLVAVLVVVSRQLWLPCIGGFPIVADELEPADGIVVLGGGGKERVQEGATLFEDGYAQWFVISDSIVNIPGTRAQYAELMRTEALWQGVPAESILTVPGIAATTCEEATNTRQLALEWRLQSLIIVTDPYHTRRARMIFRRAFRGTGIATMIRPAREHPYNASSWWRTWDGLRDTWLEYPKLVLYVMGYR